MNGIHRKIKQLRELKEYTQQYMAKKLRLSLKAYQNFENGITKLDYERLKSIAEIFEVPLEDIINADDNGVYIAEIKNNSVGYNGSEVHIHNSESKFEKELYEKLLLEKDNYISHLKATNEQLQKIIDKFIKK